MEEQITMLQKLGFQEYQAKSFAALLSRSEATADEISQISEVPITKIYAVLKSLEDLGFVKCSLSRPKLYRPIDIESVVNTIISKRQEKIDELLNKKNEIINSLNGLYDNGKKIEKSKNLVWFVPNLESGFAEAAKAFSLAKKRILIVGTPSDYKFAYKIFDVNKNWGEAIFLRGVEGMLIKPEISLNEIKFIYNSLFKILKIKKRDSEKNIKFIENPNVEIKKLSKEKIKFTMAIIDYDYLLIGIDNPLKGYSTSGLLIYDKTIVSGMTDYYLNLWQVAKPINKLFKKTFFDLVKRTLVYT